jgi:malonyl-CoA/methylmalonyl-CoA synthetase
MTTQDFNLYSRYQEQFDAHAGDELLRTDDETSYAYADIERLSARIASFLAGAGARPGDRVSVQVEKSPESLCLYLACLRAGLVYHPLNTGYKRGELEYFLENASPSVVVCDSGNAASIGEIARENKIHHVFTLDADGSGTLTTGARDAAVEFPAVIRQKDDLAALLYSSGTTGLPKGIMLTHENLYRNMDSLCSAWGFSSTDRLLHALPIYHVHGLFVALGCVLLSGASMRWLPTYDVQKIMRFLPECTVLMGVPTYYTRLLAEPVFDTRICRNIRLFVSGSAPLLVETFAEFEKRTGHRILERYGMTETNMNTSNPLHGERKPGTVGPPLPGVEVRIVDASGRESPRGETGDLQVKGANVFKGYWQMPDKTAEDFTADGFFNTGDKGVIDEDGYVSIVGRAKDLVITGGLNVYPREVELFIDTLRGVRESAVIGIPHPDFGEAVVAVVVADTEPRLPEADIIAACKRELANFKVPKRVVFTEALPRNSMAKVQKNLLRENYKDLFTKQAV